MASPQARHRKPAHPPVTHGRPSAPAAGARHRKLPGTVAVAGLPVATAGLPAVAAGLPAAVTRHRRPSALQSKSARATAVTALAVSAAATAAITHWPSGAAGHPAATQVGAMSALSAKPGAVGRPPLVGSGSSGQTVAEFDVPRPVGIYHPAISLSHPQLPRPKGKHHRPAAVAPPSGHPPSTSGSPPAAYNNPLRAVAGLIPERVDMGVDFRGSGPVYALGDAVVTSATGSSSGWPGGGWITYRLTNGPDAGLMVYVAEDVQPAVAVGEVVTPSTVIATMYNGGTGIETGWAMPNGASAESQLPEAGGIGGGGPFPTMVGLSFENLLHRLGVPASPGAGGSGYGILPPGYPAG